MENYQVKILDNSLKSPIEKKNEKKKKSPIEFVSIYLSVWTKYFMSTSIIL